jgi:hypothetical protein
MYASNIICDMPLYVREMNEPFLSNLHERYLPSLFAVRFLFSKGDD